MTSVEDALSVARFGTVHVPLAAPPGMSAPARPDPFTAPPITSPTDATTSHGDAPPVHASTAPRVSATLEHRLTWERRYHRRLGLTDAAVLAAAAGAAAISSTLGGGPSAAVLVHSVLLMAIWHLF
ncbi:hypothetical protein L2X99_10260 [Microbacterium sp. KUDC0406]|nr:hypothetical protein [Microbacterium sp. KUDC0406]UJP08873.1 hypothetical protein L2X99_10260 [Microbacterium sp. KUDC0406]